MRNLKCRGITFALTILAIAAGGAQPSLAGGGQGTGPRPKPIYETRREHDPDGTGRFYMGREIARVMGAEGISWLERPAREDEERPATVIEALGLRGGEVVVDLGAGSGYFTFRIASKIGKTGKVLAVDVQKEMLETIRQHAEAQKFTNVEVVKASETDPQLPTDRVDIVLMVDVYHELAYPYEIMTKVCKALRPGGRVVFVEYRKEDPAVPIKEVHKMAVKQLEEEMRAAGFGLLGIVETLPWQHIVTFEKRECAELGLNESGAIHRTVTPAKKASEAESSPH